MRVQTITRVSLPSFREKSAGRKIVLLYPWTNYRNLFLTHFLSSAKDGLLYYRIPTEVSSITDWMRGLTEEFNSVLGGFGSHLNAVLQHEAPPVDVLGEALAQDLGEYSEQPIVLFIDELDRMPLDNNFRKFINALVSSLPAHVQIAFSSRLLTYQPWYDMVSKGDAVVLG